MSITAALPLPRLTSVLQLRRSGSSASSRCAARAEPKYIERQALARMIHELKTPLCAVLGFAHLMVTDSEHPLSDAQRRRIELIEQAGQHMLTIIAGLLQAPADDGTAYGADDVDLGAVIEECLQWMQPTAERYGVELSAEPIYGHVRGSVQSIRQVLLNLFSNAAKYNRLGGQVRVRQLAPEGDGDVGIEVSDTGCGMSPDMLARLFTPFDRLGAEHSDVEGTGVGLCIVRDLLQRLGGRLEVRSERGQGSQFSVWFKGR
jgi:signal transduction histidine kinase